MNQKRPICTCGKSKNPPFCDHSHEHKHEHEHMKKIPVKKQLCICGKSKNPPFCDHSHQHMEDGGKSRPCACPLAPTPEQEPIRDKILLILLPYWSPLVPPHGIAHLKNFLQNYGYKVTTVDANTEVKFKQLYYKYFDVLKKFIPGNKRGNYYNIGNDVLREHMMAHINYKNESEYIALVKILVHRIFYWNIETSQVQELNEVLKEFYFVMEHYIAEMLERENPEVFGISVFRDTLPASLFSFRLCRQRYPPIKTVMGGGIFSIQLPPGSPNFEFFKEKTKDCIDKIIIGKGEQAFLQYLKSMRPKEIVDKTGADMPINPASIRDIPDLSDFDVKAYQYIGAFGSTGCPFRCSFCNVESFFGKYRKKEVIRTVDEMEEIHQKYGTRIFFMFDELLNPIITGIANEFIKREISLYWDAYLRVDEAACNTHNTMLWRRGGFYRARLGVESGSQRMLDLMNKKITVEQTRATLINLANAGIKTTVYVVIGYPGETEQDFQKTLALIEDLKIYIWEAECNPFTYFYTGQPKNDEWANQRVSLYPENAKDMLLYQTWIVNQPPTREEMYRRVNRFVELCKKLEISVAWSLADVKKADERWKKLHKNAVPSIFDLTYKNSHHDELKHVKEFLWAQDPHIQEDNVEFGL